MAFSTSTLSAQLQGISASTEAATITTWGSMWATYFAGAVAGSGPGVAFTTDAGYIATAKAAMALAMAGMCASGAAATKVQAGIVAWWDTLVASPGSYFTGASSITKPSGLTSIASDLPAQFTLNEAETTKAAACDRLATFFAGKNAGGSANISGSQTIA